MTQLTEKEIREGNIKIAEFEGRKWKAYKGGHTYTKEFPTYDKCLAFISKNKLTGYKPEIGWNLGCGEYHTSWDWLMEVVEKIEKEHDLQVSIYKNFVSVGTPTNGVYYWHGGSTSDTKIVSTWLAVVAFIDWYNKQK